MSMYVTWVVTDGIAWRPVCKQLLCYVRLVVAPAYKGKRGGHSACSSLHDGMTCLRCHVCALQIRLSMRWQRHTSRDAGPLLEEATANANSVVREVSRVLAPGGVFIVVSYEPPAGRRSVLEADDATWHLEVAGEEDEMGNYIYVCRKVGLELGTLDATLMGEEGSLIEVD
mmetsp:Transcript_19645/g.49604  ORF Transcript_19645/g.49604 Transcript_19645/m.49604 type:complete len:171 (-) Transcript_19645:128-640(-)